MTRDIGNRDIAKSLLGGEWADSSIHAASIVQAQRLEWGRMTKLERMVAPPDEPCTEAT